MGDWFDNVLGKGEGAPLEGVFVLGPLEKSAHPFDPTPEGVGRPTQTSDAFTAMGPPPTAGCFLSPGMAGEEVAIAAFHALPTGVNLGAPLAHAPGLAMGAGSCLSEVHCWEPTTGAGAVRVSGGGGFTAPGRGLHMG